MTLPIYTLVHGLTSADEAADPAAERRELFERVDRDALMSFAGHLGRNFVATLINTSLARVPTGSTVQEFLSGAFPAWVAVLNDLRRQPLVTTVGIWELGTRAGHLPRLIEQLNTAQTAFTFFKVQAAIPAGIVSQPVRVVAWLRERLDRSLEEDEQEEISANVIDADFFKRAERVRTDIGVDYLIGISPSMVAGEDEEGIYWNHISSSSDRTVLVSAYDMHEFAREAGRPLEMAVAFAAVAQLLAALNPEVEFHKDRGCLFDYNASRHSIVTSLRKPKIEKRCLDRILPRYRAAALALVETLRDYTRGEEGSPNASSPPKAPEQPPSAPVAS